MSVVIQELSVQSRQSQHKLILVIELAIEIRILLYLNFVGILVVS